MTSPCLARSAATRRGSISPPWKNAGWPMNWPKLIRTRAGLYDPGLIHEERAQRFVRHMAPSDAFVSYVWQGDRMILTHIEVDPSFRGSGLGARFAAEVFEEIETRSHEIRLTCPFLRKVGGTRANWRKKFNLGD